MPAEDAWRSTQLLNIPTFASFSLKNWGTYCLKAPGSPLPRHSEAACFPKAGQRAVFSQMSTHLWGQLLEPSPLGGRRRLGGRAGPGVRARGRTGMHRLQLFRLIHVAISEALKYGVICIEKANAVAVPITFC